MNDIYKLYCRAFQQVFHIAIPFLPYRKPELLNNMTELANTFKVQNIKRILLVTDASIRSFGITRELEETMKKHNITLTIYDKTVANPTTQNVEEARLLYLSNNCEALIGFGGGSSIDCAKAVGARIACPGKSLNQMEGILKINKKLPLLVAIPTTAGTGSETTLAAVIVDSDTRHKYPINDFSLIPRYAVLDPKVTLSLPKSLTSTTGIDALTHAVEAYIGGSTTKETRKDSLKAVNIIFKNITTAFNDGTNIKARKQMLHAAYLAGSSFTKSYVGYVHAVAHSLGGKYNTPHGLANAVILPYVLEYYIDCGVAVNKLHELSVAAGISTVKDNPLASAYSFVEAIRQLNNSLEIPDKISGIDEADIPTLAAYAAKEANPLYPVPILLDAADLEYFYYKIKA